VELRDHVHHEFGEKARPVDVKEAIESAPDPVVVDVPGF